jgi:hypothetical protein
VAYCGLCDEKLLGRLGKTQVPRRCVKHTQ